MASVDYYQLLGVARSASADDIRAAFRSLARKLHPDVNKAPDAAKKFADVQKAYEVLSDPEKRAMFDQFGEAAFQNGGPAGAPPWSGQSPHGSARSRTSSTQGDGFDPDELGSVFEAIFGGKSRRGQAGRQGPYSQRSPTDEPDVSGYGMDLDDEDDARPGVIEQEVRVDFLTAAKGGTQQFRITTRGSATGKTVEVKIPAGIEDGAQLRVRGVVPDASGKPGRAAGDLLLVVRVLPHEFWRRGDQPGVVRGLDLSFDLPLSIAEATLGATVDVPTLSGKATLTIPPGTPSGKKLRLRGLGVKTPEGRMGDLVAITQIIPPAPGAGPAISDLEKDVLRRIAESARVRTGHFWQ